MENDLNWFINNGGGKKIVLTQNGWPSMNYSGVEANSAHAVSDVANERARVDQLRFPPSSLTFFLTLAGLRSPS